MATALQFGDSGQQEHPWCAAYTRHQHEKSVAGHLAIKGIEVFLPLYASARRWSDRTKTVWLPLFPGYVFFRGAADCGLRIRETPGVHMILYNGANPARIPESEISAVRKLIAGPHSIAPHAFLKCGEPVRIRRGALSGVEGILVRKKTECRLVVSVEMLSQSVSVEVDASDVEPTAGPSRARDVQSEILGNLSGGAGSQPIGLGPVL